MISIYWAIKGEICSNKVHT